MAIARGNDANLFAGTTTTASLSFDFDAGATTNPVLLAIVVYEADSGPAKDVSGITYGGAALTLALEQSEDNNNIPNGEIWYVAGPADNTNTLAVSFSDPTADSSVLISAVVYEGVDQSSPIGQTKNTEQALATAASYAFRTSFACGSPGSMAVHVVKGAVSAMTPMTAEGVNASNVVLYQNAEHGAAGGGDALALAEYSASASSSYTAIFTTSGDHPFNYDVRALVVELLQATATPFAPSNFVSQWRRRRNHIKAF